MIVYYNVCDHCGTQKQIMSGSHNGIDVLFSIERTYESVESPHKFRNKDYKGTFCDKECYLAWLQTNLTTQGYLKIQVKVEEE